MEARRSAIATCTVRTPRDVLDAYGVWIASLAPWTHFVTLTHRLPDSSDANLARHYTRVGMSRHRRLVREWFHGAVRPRDPAARWWSELELHATGIPHEHGLLALGLTAPSLSMHRSLRTATGRRSPVLLSGASSTVSRFVRASPTCARTCSVTHGQPTTTAHASVVRSICRWKAAGPRRAWSTVTARCVHSTSVVVLRHRSRPRGPRASV
jgi:hypothetical protein